MSYCRILFILLLLWGSIACQGTSSSTTGGSDGTSSSGTESGSGGSGTGGSSGSGGSGGGFVMKGSLSSLRVASLEFGKNVATSGTVTDVMIVSPTASDKSCKTTEVDSSGNFQFTLEQGKPWYFLFFDHFKRGPSMFLGRFYSSALDTFAPTSSSGNMDLGRVQIDASTGTATSEKSYDTIVSGLGLSQETATSIGKMDDMARRYDNPDVDNDGQADCGQSNQNYMLDFHVRFNMMVSGRNVDINNIIGQFFSETNTTASYTGTGIYVSYPQTFSSLDTGSVTFVDKTVTTSEAGFLPANTKTSLVTTNNFSSFKGFGPNTTATSELPSGTILFSVGDKTLTFSDVQTPSLAEITAPTGRIFPFIRLNKTSSSCTTHCTLSGVSYQWMEKMETGWQKVGLEELGMVVAKNGGFISFRVNNNSNKTVGITIPKTSVEGTISWDPSKATLSGVGNSEFQNLETSQICHFGLSYDDQLGIRYFEGINDVAGTCS